MDHDLSLVSMLLLKHPEIRIISDGEHLGCAKDLLEVMNYLAAGMNKNDVVTRTAERLAGIAAIGLSIRLIDGIDLAQFDPIIQQYNNLAAAKPIHSLTKYDFDFLSIYGQLFNREYYVDGTISEYTCYCWDCYDPSITLPRVEAIIRAVGIHPNAKVLDFGCAVGFYVKSFLEKVFDTKGVDISRYAIENAHCTIKGHLSLLDQASFRKLEEEEFDLILVKDVLEHVPELVLPRLWATLARIGKILIVTVPITNKDGEFINPEDDRDLTHVVRKETEWWMNLLGRNARRNDELCIGLKGKKANGTLCAIVR